MRLTALAALAALALALTGCGSGAGTTESSSSGLTRQMREKPLPRPRGGARPTRYRPGDADCRAQQAPGTVGTIGEDVAGGGVRVADFVACFGPPVRELGVPGGRCLYYRDRPNPAYYWKFCVREGRIVSGLGGVRRSDLP
jgi:hypothetical protein